MIFRNLAAACVFQSLLGCAASAPPADGGARERPLAFEDAPPDGNGGGAPHYALKSTSELEHELHLERAGKVLLRSLRAHGGWDVWRRVRRVRMSLEHVAFTAEPDGDDAPVGAAEGKAAASRKRIGLKFELNPRTLAPSAVSDVDTQGPRAAVGTQVGDGDPVDPAGGLPARPAFSAARTTGADPSRGGPSGDGGVNLLADFISELAAPFPLVNARLSSEHLGMEADSRDGKTYVKVKYSWLEGRTTTWCIVYFDSTSHRMRRLFQADPAGGFRIVHLSDYIAAGDTEIFFPRRRTIYHVDKIYDHVDLDRPDSIETVLDLTVERLDVEGE